MNKLSSEIVVDILNKTMAMPPGRVWLRDQNRVIPNDDALCIVAGIVNSVVISNETFIRPGKPNRKWDRLAETYDNPKQDDTKYDVPDDQTAITQVNRLIAREDVQIDLWSRNDDAIFRNWEVVAGLQSIYAQQQQELLNFKIFRIPRQFVNTSAAEGGYQLNRYTITVAVQAFYVKETVSTAFDYFDDFTQRADDYKTVGNIPPYQYDQPGDEYDQAGEKYDQKNGIVHFEINQQGIVT